MISGVYAEKLNGGLGAFVRRPPCLNGEYSEEYQKKILLRAGCGCHYFSEQQKAK